MLTKGLPDQVEADAAARDAESRAAAVRALADVAAELFPLAPSQAPAPDQAPTPDQVNTPNTAEAAHPSAAVTISVSLAAKAGTESCIAAPCRAEERTLSEAGEVFSADKARAESPGGGCAHVAAAEVLEARVLRKLLTAAADYCTDDRREPKFTICLYLRIVQQLACGITYAMCYRQ